MAASAAAELEAATPAAVPGLIAERGFAVLRGAVPAATVRLALARIHNARDEPSMWANTARGTMQRRVLGDAATVTEPMRAVFDAMAPGWRVVDEDSPVFVASADYRGTGWHQDACVNRKPSIMAWVALTPCGEHDPGMDLIAHGVDRPLQRFLNEKAGPDAKNTMVRVAGWTVASPVFAPGDALFFNSYSIHRTQKLPGRRVSYKITVTNEA